MAGSDSTKNGNTAEIVALVNRQMQAWKKNDFAIAATDWLPTGELISPGGHVAAKDMQAAMTDYFTHFGDLRVTVKNVFLSPDGNKAAIEWDWEVTRLRGRSASCYDSMMRSSLISKEARFLPGASILTSATQWMQSLNTLAERRKLSAT